MGQFSYQSSGAITVKEARKLLGKDGALLSDDQVTEIVETLSQLAQKFFRNIGSN